MSRRPPRLASQIRSSSGQPVERRRDAAVRWALTGRVAHVARLMTPATPPAAVRKIGRGASHESCLADKISRLRIEVVEIAAKSPGANLAWSLLHGYARLLGV